MQSGHSSRGILGMAALAMVASAQLAHADQPDAAGQAFEFHQRDVLGTGMDLTVVAPTRADAELAEKKVLGEIERLRKILSAYDPEAELAKLNASPVGGEGIVASPELIEVLKQYETWSAKSGGAYSPQVAALLNAWKEGEKDNRLPTDAELLAIAKRSTAKAWEIDESKKTVRRILDQQINVDSLGKGYIVGKAVEAATKDSKPKGLMLNLGGDIRVWGSPAGKLGQLWTIGVQDPANPELNAKPLATVHLAGGRAIATSGAYHRFYTINGKKYSHIVNARTGKPGSNSSATVIAADSATANALATICCILKHTEAIALVRSVPGAEAYIILPTGTYTRTDGFRDLQDAELAAEIFSPKIPSAFPAGFKLSIDLETLPTRHRPYVFVWVTDSAGKPVKLLGAWGDEPTYWPDAPEWWRIAKNDKVMQRMTHATQAAGKYPLSWDGTDQKGNGVPLGKYRIWVEVCSEHGPHSAKSVAVELGQAPASATISKSAAFKDVTVTYGAGGK